MVEFKTQAKKHALRLETTCKQSCSELADTYERRDDEGKIVPMKDAEFQAHMSALENLHSASVESKDVTMAAEAMYRKSCLKKWQNDCVPKALQVQESIAKRRRELGREKLAGEEWAGEVSAYEKSLGRHLSESEIKMLWPPKVEKRMR